MSNKIDDRLPKEVGAGALPVHPAVKTPWEKLISVSYTHLYDIMTYKHNIVKAQNKAIQREGEDAA